MHSHVKRVYGHNLRVRVVGILIRNEKVLLIRHQGLGTAGHLWAPPGGGMEFGADATSNLRREFKEETGLEIEVGDLLFVHEVLSHPLHAIELFFNVNQTGGKLILGKDPETNENEQIMDQIGFFSLDEIHQWDKNNVHEILWQCRSFQGLVNMNGYFKY